MNFASIRMQPSCGYFTKVPTFGSRLRRMSIACDQPSQQPSPWKLATLIYRLLRWGQPYVDEGAEAYEKRYKEVRVKSLTAAAKDLGYQLTPAATQL